MLRNVHYKQASARAPVVRLASDAEMHCTLAGHVRAERDVMEDDESAHQEQWEKRHGWSIERCFRLASALATRSENGEGK